MSDRVDSQTGGQTPLISVYCKWVEILERNPGGTKLVEISNDTPSSNSLTGGSKINGKLKLSSEQERV